MAEPILQLSADELSSALEGVDPVDLLAEELADGTTSAPEEVRLTPWRGRVGATRRPMAEPLLLEDLRTGERCVLPASGLRACRAAALTGLAATAFLAPGEATAAVLSSSFATEPHLMVIARYLRRVGRLTIYSASDRSESAIEPRVLDHLDLAGVRVHRTTSVTDAVLAADLVVAAATSGRLRIDSLAKGAVVVNATNQDLPDDLVNAVDGLYVDDAALIEENRNRYFVDAHLRGRRRIDADLGQVLTGARAGRTELDHVLLVELLSANALDPTLASVLHRAALERGLGGQLFE
ncbi:hypothetical protein [Actinophytocola sp.]|uniref:hypothetical protein n=1 Tax=Actinophytocola sp. TaxID=1872138 RepID=UPI002ED55AC9